MSKNYTYEDYCNENSDKKTNNFNYIHMVCNFNNIPDDLIFSMIETISPTFKIVENMLLVNGSIFTE